MGKLIIIEGTDGSGKETQTNKLFERLSKEEKVKKITFPNYESDSSALVKMYLMGEFGENVNDVNAYAASSFFSVDRYASYKKEWGKYYHDNYVIISDRYTSANMVHQTSKIKDEKEKEKFLAWLEDFEYEKLAIPRPNLVIFLNVEIDYTFNLMKNRENKITGKENKDIHESDKNYLRASYENALNIAKNKNWIIIDCIENGKMKTIEEINDIIYNKVKEIL